jgi:hypothetical protein
MNKLPKQVMAVWATICRIHTIYVLGACRFARTMVQQKLAATCTPPSSNGILWAGRHARTPPQRQATGCRYLAPGTALAHRKDYWRSCAVPNTYESATL